MDRLKCDFLLQHVLVTPCSALMKEALLSASDDRTSPKAGEEVLGPKHFTHDADGLRMLFIDLVLVKAKDVTEALARNLARTETEGRLWPLYVDPQTYAILLRCILYGESVADQGYTWRDVFAHYRPVIEQRPQLGMFKPKRAPKGPRNKQSEIDLAKNGPPKWYQDAIVQLRADFVDDLKPVESHSVIKAPSAATIPLSTVVPKVTPNPGRATNKPIQSTTKTNTKTKTNTLRKVRMTKEALAKIALSSRVDCRHTRNQDVLGSAEDLVEQTDDQLQNNFKPLVDSDLDESEHDSEDAVESDLENISHAAVEATNATCESPESRTHGTTSPVIQEHIVTVHQTSEIVVDNDTDTDDVATMPKAVEEERPASMSHSDHVSITSSKGAKSRIITRSRKRTDAGHSNLPEQPPSLRPRTRAVARIAAISEGLSNGKKNQGRKG